MNYFCHDSFIDRGRTLDDKNMIKFAKLLNKLVAANNKWVIE